MEQVGRRVFKDTTPVQKDDRGRDKVSALASMRVGNSDDTFGVRVRNLSAGGLMTELPQPLEPDAAVEIEISGIGWVGGRVAWQTEGRAGIAFDCTIDPTKARWR